MSVQQFEIRHRYTNAVLYAGGGETLRDVVVAAVKRGANLCDANLYGANLYGANLRGADLCGADLCGADLCGANLGGRGKLVGNRPVLQIGPIGSRYDYLIAFMTDKGPLIRAGCFFDTLDAFRSAVDETHGGNDHGREYRAAIAMIEAHAAIWTPEAEVAK